MQKATSNQSIRFALTQSSFDLKVSLVSEVTCGLRSSICEGREFIDCPSRYKCPFENILLKLRTKAEH